MNARGKARTSPATVLDKISFSVRAQNCCGKAPCHANDDSEHGVASVNNSNRRTSRSVRCQSRYLVSAAVTRFIRLITGFGRTSTSRVGKTTVMIVSSLGYSCSLILGNVAKVFFLHVVEIQLIRSS